MDHVMKSLQERYPGGVPLDVLQNAHSRATLVAKRIDRVMCGVDDHFALIDYASRMHSCRDQFKCLERAIDATRRGDPVDILDAVAPLGYLAAELHGMKISVRNSFKSYPGKLVSKGDEIVNYGT